MKSRVTIAEKCPQLIEEWSEEKNGEISPYNISAGSQKSAWWKCDKGHVWSAKIGDRCRTNKNGKSGTRCPFCSGRKASEENCLAIIKAELAKEWHPFKNNGLTPYDVTCGSSKKVWWKCANGHEWEAVISSRTAGNGCRICSGRVATVEDCLAVRREDLLKQWHPNKNTEFTPFEVRCKSNKKAWWICNNGHEWQASIANRTSGHDCPYCSGHRVTVDNCFATLFPQLAREWHLKLNAKTPYDVTCGSNDEIFWQCSLNANHVWKSKVYNRVRHQKCPYCIGLYTTIENSIVTTHPHLLEEWDYEENYKLKITPEVVSQASDIKAYWICKTCDYKWYTQVKVRAHNNGGCPKCKGKIVTDENNLLATFPIVSLEWNLVRNAPLLPKDVMGKSNKKVWWICSKKHEWQSIICNRTARGDGCPYCGNKIVLPENSLEGCYPELIEQWNYAKNKSLAPSSVSPGSGVKVWWKCDKGHEWRAVIYNRTRKDTNENCPYCSGRKVCVDNCLATLRPDLVSQWHSTKNGNLTPYNFTAGSSRRTWWICTRGHEWQTAISNRTNKDNLTGCPVCNKEYQTSFPEQALFYYLSQIFEHVENQHIIVDDVDVDIFISDLNLAIEYDGYFTHNKKVRALRDEYKNNIVNSKAITLLRIRESMGMKKLPIIRPFGSILLEYSVVRNYSNIDICINDVFEIIKENQGYLLTGEQINKMNNVKIDMASDKLEIYSKFILTFKKNSFAFLYSDIATEWNYEKNFGMYPEYFAPFSNIKVWWKCKKGHQWQAVIGSRAQTNCGCPYCNGKRATDENCLATLKLNVTKFWNPYKNGDITPYDVTINSSKIFWWICECGDEWQESVQAMTRNSNCCPSCYPRNPTNNSVRRGRNFHISDSLENKYPEIAKEWDYESNEGLTPNDVSFGSGMRVNWICKGGHRWMTSINIRTHQGTQCPYCTHEKVGIDNCLATLRPSLINEWNKEKNGELTPYDVMPGSSKRVWWKCVKCGHEWDTIVGSRGKNNTGCPKCRKTPNNTNSLAVMNPKLASKKMDSAPLNPYFYKDPRAKYLAEELMLEYGFMEHKGFLKS